MKKLIFRLVLVMLVVFWALGPLQSALAGNYSKNLCNFEKIYEILKKK